MTGGLGQRSRVMAHVHRHYRDGLEAFNRASHGDALPELQLAPAEDLQFDDAPPTPREVIRTIGWRRLAIAAAFALTVWTATAAFAVMCGGDPVSTQPERDNHG